MSDLHRHFTAPLLAWYQEFGRHHLPWQQAQTPYRVWVSEIMLQQTQVQTVTPYFERFMASFPTVNDLANATEDQVLGHWSGLGYYSRARNLHASAKLIEETYQGVFPTTCEALVTLPGIGDSTAAAIVSLAFNQPATILDGNVKRVLSRYFLVAGYSETASVKKTLWDLANACASNEAPRDYTQAIMDLGATCCTKASPTCGQCPLQGTCQAFLKHVVLDYPARKPKKPLPHKSRQFLLLHNEKNQIYLEKQPAQGIWGGLWSLPNIEESACPKTHIREHYALEVRQTEELLRLTHQFSHFRLAIKAMSLCVNTHGEALATKPEGQWFAESDLSRLGLAKPISHILQHYFQGFKRFKASRASG